MDTAAGLIASQSEPDVPQLMPAPTIVPPIVGVIVRAYRAPSAGAGAGEAWAGPESNTIRLTRRMNASSARAERSMYGLLDDIVPTGCGGAAPSGGQVPPGTLQQDPGHFCDTGRSLVFAQVCEAAGRSGVCPWMGHKNRSQERRFRDEWCWSLRTNRQWRGGCAEARSPPARRSPCGEDDRCGRLTPCNTVVVHRVRSNASGRSRAE